MNPASLAPAPARRGAALALAALLAAASAAAARPDHPLEPLDAAEIEVALGVLRAAGKVDDQTLFPAIALDEPDKSFVLAWRPGEPTRRAAKVVVFARGRGKLYEARVDLAARKLASFKEVVGAQPPVSPEELALVPKIVRKDRRWQQAMRKRGITDFAEVMVDAWAPGLLGSDEPRTTRWLRAMSYLKKKGVKNGFALPIEGVIVTVDMNKQEVYKVTDTGVHPLPTQVSDLDARANQPLRPALKPLETRQPQGPEFTVDGHHVTWQKWSFRFQLHPRESLVLYDVRYDGRPILYRGSLSEMLVPYADPDKNWSFRNAFDVGEYGIGKMVDSLVMGQDVPPYATTFDLATISDWGKPELRPRAVGLYERDGGLLWKHYEFYNDEVDTVRGRDLVLTSIVTIGNYDYGFNWIFRQDASIEIEAFLTGIMLAKGVDVTREDKAPPQAGLDLPPDMCNGFGYVTRDAAGNPLPGNHWHLVAPYVAAPHHQHFFNFRLDFDIDGPDHNRVVEMNVLPAFPDDKNPDLNGLVMDLQVLPTEKKAQRQLNLASARKWIVQNGSRTNTLGQNPGFLVLPSESAVPYLHPRSLIRRRGGFIDNHLWVTPYRAGELYAAGDYPDQSEPGQGLPQWTAADRRVDDHDVVLWYTFGVTHTPRPEDWPVMPVHRTGFKLLPVAFFERNPAMDLPR